MYARNYPRFQPKLAFMFFSGDLEALTSLRMSVKQAICAFVYGNTSKTTFA